MRGLLLPALPLLLVGCGWMFGDSGRLRDHSNDYLLASSLDPLQLPPGLSSEAIEDIYYVPQIEGAIGKSEPIEVTRPQPLIAGDFDDLVKIQSLGQEQWVLVRLRPGQVWPRVREFLIQRRVGVGREDGDQGVILSPWITHSQSAFAEIYQFSLRQCLQRTPSEVRVRPAQRAADQTADGHSARLARGQDWSDTSDDRRRERLMLQQFANFLAGRVDVNAPVSLMAQGVSTASRLYMVPGDQPLIRMNLESDRAWASLGLALDKAGFKVLRGNRAASIYQVTAPLIEDDEGKKSNRFVALFKPSTYRKKDQEQATYRLKLEEAPERGWTQRGVLTEPSPGKSDESAVPVEVQQQMLVRVKAFLT